MRTTGPRINDMGHLTNSRSSRTNFAPFGGLAPDIRSAIVNLISFMFGLGWVGLGWKRGPLGSGAPFQGLQVRVKELLFITPRWIKAFHFLHM